MLANAKRAVRVDLPRQVDPEFVLFPHFTRVYFPRAVDRAAFLFGVDAEHGLAETDPSTRVRFVTGEVMSLGPVTHGKHVVREPCRFRPCRGQRDMAADEVFVRERFKPAEAVGVGPHRVVHPTEVRVELPAAFFQEVRQQDRCLVMRQRVLVGPGHVVPPAVRMHGLGWYGNELVPTVGTYPTLGADRAGQHIQHPQAAGDLPAALVPCRRGAPAV